MLLLATIASLLLISGLALALHPLIYLLRTYQAIHYTQLIPLARLRSAAQGVTEIECTLDPAPRSQAPLSGLEAAYWEVKNPFMTETPLCYSYDAGDAQPIRRFIVLKAKNEVFLVDAEHHPIGLLRNCVLVPHLRGRYQLLGADLRSRFDKLFGKERVRLVRRSHNPHRSMIRFTDQQLNTMADAAQLTLDEDIILAGETVRLFGDLHTLRASTLDQLGERVALLIQGYPARQEEAVKLAKVHSRHDIQDSEYRIHLLLKPNQYLPTVVRAIHQDGGLSEALTRSKIPIFLITGSFGMIFTFIGASLGFSLITELQDALGSGQNLLSWIDWLTIPLMLMSGLMFLGLRHSIQSSREDNLF